MIRSVAAAALLIACAAQGQEPQIAWGAPVDGLKLALAYPARGGGDLLANVLATNAGTKRITVVRTPGLRGLSARIRSTRRPMIERSFDFDDEEETA